MTCGKDSVRMFRLKVPPLYPVCIDQKRLSDLVSVFHMQLLSV